MTTTLTAVPYPYTTAAARRNIATNPSVETASTGYSVYAGTGGVAALSRQGPYLAGEHAPGGIVSAYYLRATWTTSSTAPNGAVIYASAAGAVAAGQVYSASIYARIIGTARDLRLSIEWLDAAGALVSYAPGVATMVGGWTRVSIENLTVPVGATKYQVDLLNASTVNFAAGTLLDVDTLLMEPATVAGAYFDGATSSSRLVGSRYVWEGTANASASRLSVRTPTVAAAHVTADLLLDWAETPEKRVTVHRIIGRADPIVTSASLAGTADLPTGEVTIFCLDEPTARAVVAVLGADVVMVTDTTQPSRNRYITPSRAQLVALDPATVQRWKVTASYVVVWPEGDAW